MKGYVYLNSFELKVGRVFSPDINNVLKASKVGSNCYILKPYAITFNIPETSRP